MKLDLGRGGEVIVDYFLGVFDGGFCYVMVCVYRVICED